MAFLHATAFVLAALLPTEPPAKVPCPPGPDVTISAAPRCVGETRTVVGRLDHVSRSPKGVLFVNFCADYRACPFTAVVFRDQVALFADLPRSAGAEVAITGVITTYRSTPQIVLERADQLVVRSPAPTAKVTPVIAPRRVPPPSSPFAASEADVDPAPVKPPPYRVKAVPRVEEAPIGVSSYGVFEVATHVGESAHVKGHVERLQRDGGDVLVVFTRGGREAPFVGVVLEPNAEKLGAAAKSWVGRDVELTGDVTLFNGRAAMFVNEEAQVVRASPERAER